MEDAMSLIHKKILKLGKINTVVELPKGVPETNYDSAVLLKGDSTNHLFLKTEDYHRYRPQIVLRGNKMKK